MPGFNKQGPIGQGPMTGRSKGKCNPTDNAKTDDKIRNTILSFGVALIIGLAERVWNKMVEKRLKAKNDSINNNF
jgi:hypothetical protein